jgi:hypothetical protein
MGLPRVWDETAIAAYRNIKEAKNAKHKTRPTEKLRGLREVDAPPEIQRSSGVDELFPAPEVLQSGVHGEGNGEGGMLRFKLQQSEGARNGGESLSEMWKNETDTRPPQRREPSQQREGQPNSALSELSSTDALAILRSPDADAEAVSTLPETIGEGGIVQHAPDPQGKIRRPVTDEEEDRQEVRTYPSVGGDCGETVDANNTAEARVMRLRGYGNTICAPVAEAWIRVYMEERG